MMMLLAPEIWSSHGGVQRYMKTLVSILENRSEPFTVLSLIDCEKDRPESRPEVAVASGNKFAFCWKSLRLAARTRPGVAIVGHPGLLPIPWMLTKLGVLDRYAVILHGIEAWRRLPWLWRMAARKACSIVATTNYTATEFCYHNGVLTDRCTIIPLACSFPPSVSTRDTAERRGRLLTVTRLSSADVYKGVDMLLHAVQRCHADGLKIRLQLIGDGNDRARLEDLARALEIDGIAQFRGSVTDEELKTAFNEASIFVMPSKKEGFGIVYLEAMAAGLPCIGADHGGTPEVIEHGESGFLVEYGDIAQLVFYLKALVESPRLCDVMSRAARKRAHETLTLRAMNESWNALIDRLTNVGNDVNTSNLSPEAPRLAS